MNVYVVSWGLIQGDNRIELDAIAHTDREVAVREYELVDLATVVKGKMARLRDEGWQAYCTLTETPMLDAAEKPTDDVAQWTFDGPSTVLDQKIA